MLSDLSYMPKLAKSLSPNAEQSLEKSIQASQGQRLGARSPSGSPVPTTKVKEAKDALLEKAAHIVTKRYQSRIALLKEAAAL